jgi:hypothetical protein
MNDTKVRESWLIPNRLRKKSGELICAAYIAKPDSL